MRTVGLTEGEEEEIIRRRMICFDCPFNSKNAVKDGWYESSRPDEHCTACTCNLELKTACLSCNCGLEAQGLETKWNKYNESNTNGTTDNL